MTDQPKTPEPIYNMAWVNMEPKNPTPEETLLEEIKKITEHAAIIRRDTSTVAVILVLWSLLSIGSAIYFGVQLGKLEANQPAAETTTDEYSTDEF